MDDDGGNLVMKSLSVHDVDKECGGDASTGHNTEDHFNGPGGMAASRKAKEPSMHSRHHASSSLALPTTYDNNSSHFFNSSRRKMDAAADERLKTHRQLQLGRHSKISSGVMVSQPKPIDQPPFKTKAIDKFLHEAKTIGSKQGKKVMVTTKSAAMMKFSKKPAVFSIT